MKAPHGSSSAHIFFFFSFRSPAKEPRREYLYVRSSRTPEEPKVCRYRVQPVRVNTCSSIPAARHRAASINGPLRTVFIPHLFFLSPVCHCLDAQPCRKRSRLRVQRKRIISPISQNSLDPRWLQMDVYKYIYVTLCPVIVLLRTPWKMRIFKIEIGSTLWVLLVYNMRALKIN